MAAQLSSIVKSTGWAELDKRREEESQDKDDDLRGGLYEKDSPLGRMIQLTSMMGQALD
jgi:hypothetical protein